MGLDTSVSLSKFEGDQLSSEFSLSAAQKPSQSQSICLPWSKLAGKAVKTRPKAVRDAMRNSREISRLNHNDGLETSRSRYLVKKHTGMSTHCVYIYTHVYILHEVHCRH